MVRVHPELFAEAVALRLELPGPSAARIASILLHRHEIQVSERIVRGQLRRAGLHRAGWPPSRRPTAGMRPPARTSGGSPTCWSARGCPGRAGTSPLPMGCWPSSASAMTRPSPRHHAQPAPGLARRQPPRLHARLLAARQRRARSGCSPRARRRMDEQRLGARCQGSQTPPGRLRVLAHPDHARPLVRHPQLPRLRDEPRAFRLRRHQCRPRRETLAALPVIPAAA